MTYKYSAPQPRAHLSTPHVHRSPLLPKSLFHCDRRTLARALTNDQQQLLHTPVPALSVPEDVLEAAERCGCTMLLLTRQDGSRHYAPLAALRGPDSFQVERGQYGRQRALPLRCFKRTEAEALAEPADVQPVLLEEPRRAGRSIDHTYPADRDPFELLP